MKLTRLANVLVATAIATGSAMTMGAALAAPA